jgi:hypothetical protein
VAPDQVAAQPLAETVDLLVVDRDGRAVQSHRTDGRHVMPSSTAFPDTPIAAL